MEVHILVFAFIALSYAVSASPVSDRHQDTHHLASLIKNIRRIRDHTQPLIKVDSISAPRLTDVSEFPESDLTDTFEDEDSLVKGYLGKPNGVFTKRQGAWSYDYGLGGGRFGKRNYGDYGIGGGRFGRDVDHVDLSDASDPDLGS